MKHRYWWTYQTKNKDIEYLLMLLKTKGKFCRFEYEGEQYWYQSYLVNQIVYKNNANILHIKDVLYKNKISVYSLLITNLNNITNIKELTSDEYFKQFND